MDIKIRFWCDDKCKVTASALVKTLDGLDNRNCLMLSMGRPNTNW